jgi:putative DNA primase/helicase
MSRLERIVAACGGILLDGGARALIPGPNHSRKDRSVSLMETEAGRIIIHCFSPQDDWRAVRSALMERGLLGDDDAKTPGASPNRTPAQPAVIQPESETRVARAQRIWEEGAPIGGTVAERYLLGRAIPLALTRSAALRFHPNMTSVDDRVRRPALLAAITAVDASLQGVQVTLLSKHGAAKAAVATSRRVIGRLLGGTVRLDGGEEADVLTIGEGVETMLSASDLFGAPAWAALSAHNLSLFEPPSWLKALIVAVDNDGAGHAAARTLKERAQTAMDVALRIPDAEHNDWNAWAVHRLG